VRRRVLVAADLFHRIEELLPEEPSRGLPSRAQFIERDLMAAFDVFQDRWDQLPPIYPGREDYRELIGAGALVYSVVFIGRLRTDGAIELLDLDIDPLPPTGLEEADDES
jgi:hypothetical protein